MTTTVTRRYEQPTPEAPSMEDIRFDSTSSKSDGPGIAWAVAPLLERWRSLLFAGLAAGLLGLAVSLLRPERYEAKITLAAVSSARLPGGLDMGLASSLLGNAMSAGLQPTPALVVQLTTLHGVVYPVAMSRVDSATGTRIIDRLAGKHISTPNPEWVDQKMSKLVDAGYDRQTGLITISVTHRDSALARMIVERIVAATGRTFVTAARAQATELRRAQVQRVDSAEHHLQALEQEMLTFNRENRSVMPYSPASLERQQLQRELDIAQNVYTHAVADREAAVAKELEDTPTVVAVDPLPSELPSVSKHTALTVAISIILALTLLSVGLIGREAAAMTDLAKSSQHERIRAALRDIPLIRSLVA